MALLRFPEIPWLSLAGSVHGKLCRITIQHCKLHISQRPIDASEHKNNNKYNKCYKHWTCSAVSMMWLVRVVLLSSLLFSLTGGFFWRGFFSGHPSERCCTGTVSIKLAAITEQPSTAYIIKELSKYFGDYKFNGETRNGFPVFVLDMAKAWWDPSPPTQATFSRHQDGIWYVQSAAEPENSGSIFRSNFEVGHNYLCPDALPRSAPMLLNNYWAKSWGPRAEGTWRPVKDLHVTCIA